MPFLIHSSLLTNSPILIIALKSIWKEGQDNTITLPEQDREAFGIYAKWLYNGRVAIASPDRGAESDDDSMDTGGPFDAEHTRWENCYALADCLQDTDSKDALIDTAVSYMKDHGDGSSCPWHTLGPTIYKYSHVDRKHRDFVVKITATFLDVEDVEMLVGRFECEGFVDVFCDRGEEGDVAEFG